MSDTAPNNRKLVRHIEDPAHCRTLTFSCYRQKPLLTNDAWRRLLAEAIDQATAAYAWRLVAYVFMPEHVHLMVYPTSPEPAVDVLLRAIKRPYSFRIKQLLQEAASPLLEELRVRQRPGVEVFRYWQEGPGHDRNLFTRAAVLSNIDYIHQNPVRRGLSERATDWRWSSARHYVRDAAQPPLDVPTIHGLPAHWLDEGGVQSSG